MATHDLHSHRAFVPGFVLVVAGCVWLLMAATAAQAAELPKPSAAVLLSISGNIENHNRKGSQGENIVDLDLAMIMALERHSFRTKSPWTENETQFEGARLNALLEFVGAGSDDFRATALDEYSIKVTDIDFNIYPVIAAYARDGKPMSVRNLGPLWIMFPFDDFPELLNEKNKASAIWQLNAMVVL